MSKRQPAIKSKIYKGVRNYSVSATLRGDVVEVAVKRAGVHAAGSPLTVPVSEWRERHTANRLYDKWHYLDSRYNPDSAPTANRLLDEVRKAIDEIVPDDAEPAEAAEAARPQTPPGFRVLKHVPGSAGEWQSGISAPRTLLDVLYEMLARGGFSLTPQRVERFKLDGKQFYSIEGDAVIVCPERELTRDVILAMATLQPRQVLCLERAFGGDSALREYAAALFAERGVKDFVTV